MNRRRALLGGGKKQVFVFKEGEGLVFGNYLAGGSSSYNYITNDYIHLAGRAYSSSTHDDDESYGMVIDENPISKDSYGYIIATNGFDFSKYKTLYFEYALTTSSSPYGYVGYGAPDRMSNSVLDNDDNKFDSSKIKTLFKNGEKKEISGTTRQIVSFDISAKANGRLVLLSPHAYYSSHYAEIYNIWFE